MGIKTSEFGNKGKIRKEYDMKPPAQEGFGVSFKGERGTMNAQKRKGFNTRINPSGK